MTHLAHVSSAVQSTSFPTLSRIGKSFASTIPDPDVFFKKTPQHCDLFRQEFPEVYLVPEKTGYLKATWQFATYFFSNMFSHQLEPIKSRSEVFASLFEKGKQGLSQISDDLNHLENLLAIPNVLSQAESKRFSERSKRSARSASRFKNALPKRRKHWMRRSVGRSKSKYKRTQREACCSDSPTPRASGLRHP